MLTLGLVFVGVTKNAIG